MRQVRTSTTGAVLVLALLTAGAALTWLLATWTLDAWGVLTGSAVVTVDAVLGVVAAAAGTGTGIWLLAGTSWCALSLVRGLEAPALTPLALRRLLVLMLGAGLAATASPGHAATVPASAGAAQSVPGWQPTGQAPGPGPGRHAAAAPGPGAGAPWVPGPPPGATRPAEPGPGPGSGADAATGRRVVAPGDTLWDIAARDLGPDATPAQIAQAWPAWHARNLDTIGPDPDRIFPGQRLRPPA